MSTVLSLLFLFLFFGCLIRLLCYEEVNFPHLFAVVGMACICFFHSCCEDGKKVKKDYTIRTWVIEDVQGFRTNHCPNYTKETWHNGPYCIWLETKGRPNHAAFCSTKEKINRLAQNFKAGDYVITYKYYPNDGHKQVPVSCYRKEPY